MKKFIKKYFKKPPKSSDKRIEDENMIGLNCSIHYTSFGIHNSIGSDCYLYNSSVGDFTFLSKNVSMMNTTIGKFCSVAQGVGVGLGEHPASVFVSSHPAFYSPYKQCGYTFTDESHFPELGNNIIGNDVWIGVNAMIMNNINIGNGVIIGAGAIVTKHVPDYAVVVGSPAKVIRYRFTEQEINLLLSFKWWDKDYKWIEENYKSFLNINDFLSMIKGQSV